MDYSEDYKEELGRLAGSVANYLSRLCDETLDVADCDAYDLWYAYCMAAVRAGV